jgi:hypothetical protein
MDRKHERHGAQELWCTFDPDNHTERFAAGFGALDVLNESRLPPGAAIPGQPSHDGEVVTYVRSGALAQEDSIGRSGVINAGEFHRTTANGSLRHRATNALRAEWAHVFQLGLRSSEAGLETSQEPRRFDAAEREGKLCVVASPDGRGGSLRIHQDALVYSAILHGGQRLVCDLARGRGAWLHVVVGMVTLGDLILGAGDAAAFTMERSVSLTAREESEVLLLDLHADRKPRTTQASRRVSA